MDIGLNIRKLRRSRHIRQKTLAEAAGISNTYLSDIENGRTVPSLKALLRIAEALGINLSLLLE